MRDLFAERFRQARKGAALSQDDIAAVCKNREGDQLSRSAIAQWETPGGARPNFYNLVASARRIGTSIDWLVGLSDKTTPAGSALDSDLVRRFKSASERDKKIISQLLNIDPNLLSSDQERVTRHLKSVPLKIETV